MKVSGEEKRKKEEEPFDTIKKKTFLQSNQIKKIGESCFLRLFFYLICLKLSSPSRLFYFGECFEHGVLVYISFQH